MLQVVCGREENPRQDRAAMCTEMATQGKGHRWRMQICESTAPAVFRTKNFALGLPVLSGFLSDC